MNDKFYKVVQVFDNRLFSMNAGIVDILRLIKKQPKFMYSQTIEYKLGKWTKCPKIGDDKYKRLLFVYKGTPTLDGQATYECEVKNPIPINELYPSWSGIRNVYLVTAVKLIKPVHENS